MKNLMTAVASLLILLLFVLQFAGNQVIHNRLFRADMAIEAFRDVVKDQGYVSVENKDKLTATLAQVCGCASEQILVSGSAAAVKRGELITYRVRFPLSDMVAAGESLGISQEENMAWFEDEGWVVSRYEEDILHSETVGDAS